MKLDSRSVRCPDFQELSPANWLNSSPLAMGELRGRVVLVDFWDYTCINCIRSLAYIRGWQERYAASGLTVIGVHTPEFAFARDAAAVRRGLDELRVTYPVVLDNDTRIWKAFANRAWPSRYLVDGSGYLRHRRSGEGGYQETERAIRHLLGQDEDDTPLIAEAAVPSDEATPELYLGWKRGQPANEGGFAAEQCSRYDLPDHLTLFDDGVELGGLWVSREEYCQVAGSGPDDPSRLRVNYCARGVHLVAAPADDGLPGRLGITAAPELYGDDVQQGGFIDVTRPRLYSLITCEENHLGMFELVSASRGLRLYALSFTP
ncbi:MAG: redoxin family protein [Bryobacterales bacterium]|nr:redoxin family protein [Bryobacterales bacterium]